MERETTVAREPRGAAVVKPDIDERYIAPETAAAAALARDPITWGPIWAGVITAFGLFILFSLLAIAAGLAVVEFDGGAAAGEDVPVDMIASIVSGLFLVVAFFAGGLTASWSAGLVEEGRGILHGFLVWALSLVLLLVLAALGLGQVFGAAGEVFGQLGPGVIPNPDIDPEQLAQAAQDASWATVFAIVLAMASAILGGLVGTNESVSRRWSDYTAFAYRR
jgi:hypothetical protein